MLSKEKKVVETNGGKNPVSTGNLHHTSTKVKLKTNDVQLFFRISLSDDIISFLSLTNIILKNANTFFSFFRVFSSFFTFCSCFF